MNKTYQFNDLTNSQITNSVIERKTEEIDDLQAKNEALQTDSSANFENSTVQVKNSAETVSPSRKTFHWFLIWFLFSCGLGGLTAFAFLWLAALPPAVNCEEISALSPDIERLHCAQAAAQSGELPELIAGLDLVETWTPEHPLYNEANRWMGEWSTSVLRIARQRMRQSDMDGALELANRIPTSSPVYAEAQATIAQWQERWQQGETVYHHANEALKHEDWDLAYAKILELRDHPYEHWNTQQANVLSEQVQQEKQARRTLAEANSIAQLQTPQQLVAAIDRLKQIDQNTHTWQAAQPILKQWGETLLVAGEQRWQSRQFEEAITFAEAARQSADLTVEAENLIKLSQARRLAVASGSPWKVTPRHIWRMMEAVSAAQQIPPDSRFHAQAQTSLAGWNAQLQDMLQLQSAQIAASLGNREAVEAAIAQAEKIESNRPRRLQAQTLIAHWRLEAERLEDQPILLYAQKLAEAGTLASLKAAIQEVNQIPSGHVLRGEAQGLAYVWNHKVEILEDEPFLKMAQSQARQGLLKEAIQTVSVIRPGRALYGKAQSAIGDWQAEVYRAERRDRFNRHSTEPVREERSSERADGDTPASVEFGPVAVPNHESSGGRVSSDETPSQGLSNFNPAERLQPAPRSSERQLPRTINELMQTHPRPTPERLSPNDLSPSQPPAIGDAPPAEVPVVEERSQPQAVPAPVPLSPNLAPAPNPIVEELAPLPVEAPIAPAIEAPTNNAPANNAPANNELGSEPIEAFPLLNEPVSAPDEQGQPLSEDWNQPPFSHESTVSIDWSAPVNTFVETLSQPTEAESASKTL